MLIVVYHPDVPFGSVIWKYPVNCPDSVFVVAAAHVLPTKYPDGGTAVRPAMLMVFALPVVALNCQLFSTYPV